MAALTLTASLLALTGDNCSLTNRQPQQVRPRASELPRPAA